MLVLILLGFGIYEIEDWGYNRAFDKQQKVIDSIHENVKAQAIANEKHKTEVENEHATNTILLAQNYDSQLADLNQRLLKPNVSDVPRKPSVPVADGFHSQSGVSEASGRSGKSDETFTIGSRVVTTTFYQDALDTALQLRYLQNWVNTVCTK